MDDETRPPSKSPGRIDCSKAPARKKAVLQQEYQQLKLTLHRKLVDTINLEALSTLDNHIVRTEVRKALDALIDAEPTLLSSAEKRQISDEVLDEVFGWDRWSRSSRTPPSPISSSTRTNTSTSSAPACWS